ncbi:MAG: hypothetical protein JRD89_00380 [Deltaproteobacteria bacterium]|nr:hypothetical protein [Deltaproteobacteria bacterium]
MVTVSLPTPDNFEKYPKGLREKATAMWVLGAGALIAPCAKYAIAEALKRFGIDKDDVEFVETDTETFALHAEEGDIDLLQVIKLAAQLWPSGKELTKAANIVRSVEWASCNYGSSGGPATVFMALVWAEVTGEPIDACFDITEIAEALDLSTGLREMNMLGRWLQLFSDLPRPYRLLVAEAVGAIEDAYQWI